MKCIGQGAYANVFAEGQLAYKLTFDVVPEHVHTVLREGLLLAKGHGPGLVGLCADSESQLIGFSMMRAARTLDSAMEWARARLERPTFDTCVRSWFRDALLQLRALHDSSLVHADVKPHNVLVMPHGQCVLADYGLTRRRHAPFHVPAFTKTYRAPELEMDDTRSAEPPADLWALAVSFVDAMTVEATKQKGPFRNFSHRPLWASWLTGCEAGFADLLWSIVSVGEHFRPSVDHLLDLLIDLQEGPRVEVSVTSKEIPDVRALDFHMWTSPTLSSEDVAPQSLSVARTVCKNVCNLIQLSDSDLWPHVAKLFRVLHRAGLGHASAPYASVLVQSAVASVCGVLMVREASWIRLEHVAKICSLTTFDFEKVLMQGLPFAIRYHEWSDGLFGD